MLEIVEQLSRYGDRVVDEVPAVTGAEVRADQPPASALAGGRPEVAPAPESIDARRSHRNRWLAAAAVVAVLAALAGALVLRDDEDGADDVITTPDPTVDDDIDPTFGYAPGWHELDAGPLSPRDDSEVVWTGTELLVFGGHREVGSSTEWPTDGAVYDPTTRTWRPMSPMPPDLSYADSVWAGTELIVLGSQDEGAESAWAYDPRDDAWRELASPPSRPEFPTINDEPSVLPVQGGGGVWTGEQAVMFTPHAAYDPAADTWTPLAGPPPFEVGDIGYDFEWNGTDAVFWTWDTPDVAPFAYRPAADEWQILDTPLDGNYLTIAAVDGSSSVVLAESNPGGSAGLLDLEDDSWRQIEHPGDMALGCSSFTLGGQPALEVMRPVGQGFLCGDVMLLDDNDEWVRLPFDLQDPEGSRQLISTGDAVFEWTSYDATVVADQRVAGTSSLRLWVPPPLDELEPIAAPPTTEAPTPTTTSTSAPTTTTTAAPTTTSTLPVTTTLPPPGPVTTPPWSGDTDLPNAAFGNEVRTLVMAPNAGCTPPDDPEEPYACPAYAPYSEWDNLQRLTIVAGEPFTVGVGGEWDAYLNVSPRIDVCEGSFTDLSGAAMPATVTAPGPGQYWVSLNISAYRTDGRRIEGIYVFELDIVSALGVPPPPAAC
jgi:hypothetical protein